MKRLILYQLFFFFLFKSPTDTSTLSSASQSGKNKTKHEIKIKIPPIKPTCAVPQTYWSPHSDREGCAAASSHANMSHRPTGSLVSYIFILHTSTIVGKANENPNKNIVYKWDSLCQYKVGAKASPGLLIQPSLCG